MVGRQPIVARRGGTGRDVCGPKILPGSRSARRGSPRPPMPSPAPTDPRDIERLIEEAARAARRLRRVCADWPEARFADLAYGAALARLRADLGPAAAEALRAEVARDPDPYRARLRERTT